MPPPGRQLQFLDWQATNYSRRYDRAIQKYIGDNMNRAIKKYTLLAGTAAILSCGANSLVAQPAPGMGDFDPAEFRQRMMDQYRETLGVKSDDEWKLIQERIQKVMDARQGVGFGGMGFMGGRRGGFPGGGPGMMGQTANPEREALQKTIEGNASKDEIKAKLAAYRESRKAKQVKLEAAQAELQKLLTQKQEAAAVLMGLLE
jgi:hypothetical protein